MARLNTAPEPTPSRESSLYRDPKPLSTSRRAPTRSSTRASTYSVLSPSPAPSSDKENRPDPRDDTPRANRKDKPMGPPRLPTPRSETPRSSKRRRLGEYNIPLASRGPVNEDANLGDIIDLEYYDPDQDPEERRELRREMRQNFRDMNDRRDELIAPDNYDLLDHLNKASHLMKKVKQTSDAVIDSRFLVTASDLALKKTANTVRGDTSAGVDLDEFVSKCITFMRISDAQGEDDERPVSTQARRHLRRTGADSDDEEFEDIGDGLDWGILGERACFPCNRRPPVPSFLLGPLSVQKRVRTIQLRRGRLQKETRGPMTRPESLEPEDLEKAENSNLTKLVAGIRVLMKDHIENSMETVEEEMSMLEGAGDDEFQVAMRRHRICLNSQEDASVSLFDFVVNPRSFGQTVENLFYVSFLIREGNVKVDKDSNGLPVLCPANPRKIQEQRDQGVSNHQAVFSLDWPTWNSLIEAFDIKEPLIPHRKEDENTTINARGWYG